MEFVQEHVRFAELLRIYGNLLSDRQREYMQSHYVDDLSYGEIAEQSGVSRQAVHDAIAHGRKSLLRFENELSLLPDQGGEGYDDDGILRILNRLEQIASEDILYDTRRLRESVRELKVLLIRESDDV